MKLMIYDNREQNRLDATALMRAANCTVDATGDAEEAVDLLRFYGYDAVMLGFAPLLQSGYDLIERVCALGKGIPVTVLAPGLAPEARLRLLELGITDLITETITDREMVLRVQNQARRHVEARANSVSVGPSVVVDLVAQKVLVHGRPVRLTRKEYQIVELLAMNRGRAMSKDSILDHLYDGLDEPNKKIIDVFVCKARRKLDDAGADAVIETRWGLGYMIDTADRMARNRIEAAETAPAADAQVEA